MYFWVVIGLGSPPPLPSLGVEGGRGAEAVLVLLVFDGRMVFVLSHSLFVFSILLFLWLLLMLLSFLFNNDMLFQGLFCHSSTSVCSLPTLPVVRSTLLKMTLAVAASVT